MCAESKVQQQSRMRRVASADSMKGKHQRRPRRRDNVAAIAAAMQADAAAPRVPSTQCMRLQTCEALNRAARSASGHGSTGVGTACQARLHWPSSGSRPSRGSGKRSRRTCMLQLHKLATQRPYPIAAMHQRTPSRHQTAEGSMPDTWLSRSPCSSSRCSD